jgi:E3 ubiquitin-protein ligase SHPRH
VTPPSLLKQWVSEMRVHSPSVRVCVYEGWKSLEKGIQAEHGRSQRAADARKRIRNDTSRRQTVRKYKKANGRGVKVELSPDTSDTSDEEEEQEKPAESSLEITQRKFVDYVRAHDVVITTYQ